MNGCKQPTHSHVSPQVHSKRFLTRRRGRRRGLPSDPLAEFLAETLRHAVELGNLHPPLLVVAIAGDGAVLAVRYDGLGVESAGAMLFDRMPSDLFAFPIPRLHHRCARPGGLRDAQRAALAHVFSNQPGTALRAATREPVKLKSLALPGTERHRFLEGR